MLGEYGDAMAESEHPIVQYAAGWVAAELALYRGRNASAGKKVGYEDRQEHLAIATERWNMAADGMPALRSTITGSDLRASLYGIELRLLEALSYVPKMEVGASVLARADMGNAERQARYELTRQRTARLARFVLDLPPESNAMHAVKVGSVSEVACGAVGQSYDQGQLTIVPSSFRQDHHAKRYLRSDYIAISHEYPFKKSLVQVTTSQEHGGWAIRRYCKVVANRDLLLGPDRTVADTLVAFEKSVVGGANPKDQRRLRAIARQLYTSIVAKNAEEEQELEQE